MIVENLVFDSVIFLCIFDIGDEVLGMMGDFYVKYFFVVNNIQLLGFLFEDDILNNDVEEVVGFY